MNTTCPHCNKPINLGSLAAKARWAKTSKKDRLKVSEMMNARQREIRLNSLSTVTKK